MAVIGVPDETTGEGIKAFIALARPGLTAKDVIEFCRQRLTAYKVPKLIVFVDQLPKSPVGKILRSELRKSI